MRPKEKSEIVKSENIQQTFTIFCANQYVHIMVKMAEACEQTGITKDDMLVELNFKPNQNGIVPAMQDKPEFKWSPRSVHSMCDRTSAPGLQVKFKTCTPFLTKKVVKG